MVEEDAWKTFIAGGIGGVWAVTSGHPLDTIKVRLQAMPKPLNEQSPLYSGAFDCFKQTVRSEGIRGLYKGLAAVVVGVAPISALNFLGFDLGKLFVRKLTSDESDHLTLGRTFISACFSGVLTTAIVTPTERIKCLLQVQQSSVDKKYNGSIDCAVKLYKEGGVRSLYRGTLITLCRSVPASGTYFTTYVGSKRLLSNSEDDVSTLTILLAGGFSGIMSWVIAMPQDVLKSRYQTYNEYNGIKDVYLDVWRNEGVKGMYKGFVPVMIRAVPSTACCFFGYELSIEFLNYLTPSSKA